MRQSGLRRCGSAMSPTDPMQGPVRRNGDGRMPLRKARLADDSSAPGRPRRPSRTRRTRGARWPPRSTKTRESSIVRCRRPARVVAHVGVAAVGEHVRDVLPRQWAQHQAFGLQARGIRPKTRRSKGAKAPGRDRARFGASAACNRFSSTTRTPSERSRRAVDAVPGRQRARRTCRRTPGRCRTRGSSPSARPACSRPRRTASQRLGRARPRTRPCGPAPSASTTRSAALGKHDLARRTGHRQAAQHLGAHGNQLVALAQRHHGLARARPSRRSGTARPSRQALTAMFMGQAPFTSPAILAEPGTKQACGRRAWPAVQPAGFLRRPSSQPDRRDRCVAGPRNRRSPRCPRRLQGRTRTSIRFRPADQAQRRPRISACRPPARTPPECLEPAVLAVFRRPIRQVPPFASKGRPCPLPICTMRPFVVHVEAPVVGPAPPEWPGSWIRYWKALTSAGFSRKKVAFEHVGVLRNGCRPKLQS